MKTFKILETLIHIVEAENEDEAMGLINNDTVVDAFIDEIIEEGE